MLIKGAKIGNVDIDFIKRKILKSIISHLPMLDLCYVIYRLLTYGLLAYIAHTIYYLVCGDCGITLMVSSVSGVHVLAARCS